jgi:4-deoxy-L-threo-5-hexosulose-uronate ketol-isomerase
MTTRYESSPREVRGMNTQELRENFLIDNLMRAGEINFVYSHYDRVIVGGAVPQGGQVLTLPTFEALKADFFLQRRELGVINVGGEGEIAVGEETHRLSRLDCLYVGKGQQEVVFRSLDDQNPAVYYLLSAPAHREVETQLMRKEEASPMNIGSAETSNERTVYKYIHEEGLKSCQLVMGLTKLQTGSVWNTMPSHTHDRRMEAYFYFDLDPEQVVFHLMGQPQETRHMVLANHQAILSPPWSIHSGCGTSNYSFIWGMAGENYNYKDMDVVAIPDLR